MTAGPNDVVPMDLSGSARLVTIGHVYGLPEAAIAIGKLRAAGILVQTSNHETAAVASHYMHALGGIDLQVLETQAVDALAILSDRAPHPSRSPNRLARLVMVIAFLILAVPPPASGLFLRRVVAPSAVPGEG